MGGLNNQIKILIWFCDFGYSLPIAVLYWTRGLVYSFFTFIVLLIIVGSITEKEFFKGEVARMKRLQLINSFDYRLFLSTDF